MSLSFSTPGDNWVLREVRLSCSFPFPSAFPTAIDAKNPANISG